MDNKQREHQWLLTSWINNLTISNPPGMVVRELVHCGVRQFVRTLLVFFCCQEHTGSLAAAAEG
jgi:hypothetical protein